MELLVTAKKVMSITNYYEYLKTRIDGLTSFFQGILIFFRLDRISQSQGPILNHVTKASSILHYPTGHKSYLLRYNTFSMMSLL